MENFTRAFTVSGNVITDSKPTKKAGNAGENIVTSLSFTFSSEWDDAIKSIVFKTPKNRLLTPQTITGSIAPIPQDALDSGGTLQFSLMGAFADSEQVIRTPTYGLDVESALSILGGTPLATYTNVVLDCQLATQEAITAKDAAVLATERIEITGAEMVAAKGDCDDAAAAAVEIVETVQGKLDRGEFIGPAGANGMNGVNGAAGPNSISASTTTNITGLLAGNGTNVSAPTAAQVGSLPIPDAGGYFAVDTLDGVLQSVGGQLAQKANTVTYSLCNLIDPAVLESGKYIIPSNGETANSASYNATGFIPCIPGEVFVLMVTSGDGVRVLTSLSYTAFYNSSHVRIAGGFSEGYRALVPAGAAYFRTSLPTTLVSPSIEKFTNVGVASSYLAYGAAETITVNANEDNIDMFLPPVIYTYKTATVNLYYDAILGRYKNPYRISPQYAAASNVGTWVFKDRVAVYTTVNTGGTFIILNVLNAVGGRIRAVFTRIEVLAVATATKTICPVGDSLSTAKQWCSEIMLLNSNYTFVGSAAANNIPDSASGLHAFHHEGHSGWSALQFYTLASVGGVTNPFWSGTAFSYSYYITNTLGGVAPNAIILFLGMNAIALDITAEVASIVGMINNIRAVSATVPIIVCAPQYRDYKHSMNTITGIYDLMVGLSSAVSAYSNLVFVPLAITHDSEYNYQYQTSPVNSRSAITEPEAADVTHPQGPGYWQFADAIFGALCRIVV